MSVVRIYEYNDMAYDRTGYPTAYLQEPSLNVIEDRDPLSVEIGSESADSDQFSPKTHFIRIIGEADFFYEINAFNTAVDAANTGRKGAAGAEIIVAVPPGGFLSVIEAGT